ncbi:sigma 54-interacting transcriptional regulator [Desulfatitalea alkaliphila]|uniref:Sigma 54-interacting transcriptional regulator n=1 Tax=Desulfatitalea alkaliphila TaxID=2929485 RepID=A0AA41R5M0_9BACT|nr:sigma 54-interacting transcriptional regulator [Desulfatitalea alkaliphila]MCJ8501470.1 sigma 54-interacting transcriptional regulator [Desulfatitalea alkaliphila]
MPDSEKMIRDNEPAITVSGRHDNFESALKEAHRQYRQLIDDLPDGYAEYDLEGNLTAFNQATIDTIKESREDLLNLPFKTFMDEQTAARVYQVYNEVYRTGIPKKGEVFDIIRKDGTIMTLECSISLKRVNGKIVGFRGIWHDITERKKAETDLANHRKRLQAIFGSVKEGIIAVNARGHVTDANSAIETICGVPIETILTTPHADAQTPCCRSCHAVLQETLAQKTEIKERQIGCRRNDRPQQVVVLNSSPLVGDSGENMGAVLVIRDITELLGLEKELRGRYKFQNLIGKSKKMQEIYDLLETLASLETTILVTGQSGTGKELVAGALHYAGERANKPFVKVNCSALTESLLESELFGHVQGAFTGATKDRQGRFQMAEGGTILLDEIGDISPTLQLKLLRVLQEKEFERVGESVTRKVDVRIITCTNKDLKEKVRLGEFREDLYYRLKVMEIALPPLSDRMEDLPLLVSHFCSLFNARYKKSIDGVSNEALNRFANYDWPGNVRELEHVLEHAYVLCSGSVITMEVLPAEMRSPVPMARSANRGPSKKTKYSTAEILDALEKTHWNKTKAARLLGLHRHTIHRKVKALQLINP